MGYKRQELQILGGGFNLLPPGDKTPRTDYLLAQNWRVDKAGKLVSRCGYAQKFSIGGAGLAHSAFVYGGVNGDYYVGCNNSLTAPSGSLYFNFGGSPIKTGFDGNRIGMVGQNGYVYVMNQAHQGRARVGVWEDWNIAAPANSPVPAAAATPGTTANATYNYTLQGDPAYIHYLTIAGTTYSFAENGYSAGQIPLVIASLASADPNATVTYSGSGTAVVITPIVPNTLIALSGSDGNSPAAIATGAISSLPNGTYQYYVTYESSDQTLESNPSPVSKAVALSGSAVTLTSVPVSPDSRVGRRNIYATGGTLGQAYLVGALNDNSTTTITISTPDLDATNGGTVMPTDNDPPPAAAGLIGPHFSRLFAWLNNRLYYTNPNLPQYWPGSADPAIGNWVNVGAEGEDIVWCTIHGNLLVIYKERSIWMLVGDPQTGGYLQKVLDGFGLNSQWSVTEAGAQDYLVSGGGLYRFDMDKVHPAGDAIAPLFNSSSSFSSALAPPGGVLPGSAFNSTSTAPYAVALGYAMGKLYVSYAENNDGAMLLVYHEESARWFYHRNAITGTSFWFGFIFDGVEMVGLTGSAGGAALGENLDDFRSFFTTDVGSQPIACVYQSHYEDCALPDNQKNWLEVVIEYEFAGDTAAVYVYADNGSKSGVLAAGLSGTSRKTASFALALDTGTGGIVIKDPTSTTQTDLLAKNLSIAVSANASNLLILHNVYLYYYEEARLANSASTVPIDLGSPKVKQCKELQLDIDPNGAPVKVGIYSDLPGNALAVRQTPATVSTPGRAVWKFPFSVTEGFLWRLALTGTQFRLYSVRLLMRPIGTYVEAYEAAAGFVWDSMETTFDSGVTHIPRGSGIALAALPIKRAREISLQIDTFNLPVTLTFLSDLPGNAMTSRFTATVNTGTAGRRFVRIPLPAGTSAPIEGRMFQIKLSGTSKFVLYEMAVEILAVGVYIEAYEAAGGAVYDSREIDFGVPDVKEARELELDIEAQGAVTVGILSDLTATFAAPVNSIGGAATRQKIILPLTVSAAAEQFVEGRLLRLILSSAGAFALYGARLKVRPFGCYLTASEAAGGALWDSTDLDLGSQTVKQIREIELDLWAYGPYTVTVYTDLPGGAMTPWLVSTKPATTGRTKVQIPLPQGAVPDNYLFGRLVRVTVTSLSAFKLFGARIHARPIGVYVESYEAAGGAVWDSTPSDLGSPNDKTFDEVRFECDTDGAAAVAVYTDLPGEAFTSKGTFPLTTGPTGRHWATVPLPAGIEGRSIRMVVSSATGFRIYRAQVRSSRIGRYLCAVTPAGNDAFNTLEFDFSSERLKAYKKIEVDLRADGIVNLTVLTNQQSGTLAPVYTPSLATPSGREPLSIILPPGIRGRLLRLSMTSTAPARIYKVRVWARPENELRAQWAWVDYPCEDSDVLPAWSDLTVPPTPDTFSWADLPVPPTKPEWEWAPLPVLPTQAQWFWAKVLEVEETPNTWDFVDVPFEVTG